MRLQSLIKNILLGSHPVGTIYMTTDSSFNPQVSWGGQWQKIENRFLLGASSTYSLGSTGGEASHTLTVDEMPSHNHYPTLVGNGGGSGDTCVHAQPNGNRWWGNVGSQGGSQPHNNMPPYLAVNIWKRIA